MGYEEQRRAFACLQVGLGQQGAVATFGIAWGTANAMKHGKDGWGKPAYTELFAEMRRVGRDVFCNRWLDDATIRRVEDAVPYGKRMVWQSYVDAVIRGLDRKRDNKRRIDEALNEILAVRDGLKQRQL